MYDVAPVAEAASGVQRGIASDLAQASAAGADITVDLAALYAYYNKLVQLDDDLGRHIRSLGPADPYEHELPGAASGVPRGVETAFEATRAARYGASSFVESVKAVQAQVRDHLEALRHNYMSYLTREDDNVGRLDKTVPWADKPLGW